MKLSLNLEKKAIVDEKGSYVLLAYSEDADKYISIAWAALKERAGEATTEAAPAETPAAAPAVDAAPPEAPTKAPVDPAAGGKAEAVALKTHKNGVARAANTATSSVRGNAARRTSKKSHPVNGVNRA